MKETHYIYRITHLPTGRFYIGKRSCKGSWQDDRYMGSGKVMKALLKKYPLDQFRKEVLCLCRDAAQALHAERAAIGTQWRDNPLCINLREGGEGVRDFWNLPENRAAHSMLSSKAQKKRFEDPAQREAQSERQKKRWADPAQREALSERTRKYFDLPENREAHSERTKKRFEDPAQREAHSAAQIKDTVRLSKDGVIYEISKEQLLTELVAGSVFCGNMTAIHHPTEGVWCFVNTTTAKRLLLLDCGWEFGGRRVLERITLKHVDKATGRVLPRS